MYVNDYLTIKAQAVGTFDTSYEVMGRRRQAGLRAGRVRNHCESIRVPQALGW